MKTTMWHCYLQAHATVALFLGHSTDTTIVTANKETAIRSVSDYKCTDFRVQMCYLGPFNPESFWEPIVGDIKGGN